MGKAAQRKRASRTAEHGGADALTAYDLLKSARRQLQASIPSTFTHKGRTYYLQIVLGQVGLKVFETATSTQPIAFAIAGSSDEFGHQLDN
jgi:hypothetical protein